MMPKTDLVCELVRLAIAEDLPFGDITSQICVSETAKASAVIIARERQVVCGIEIIPMVLGEIGDDWTYHGKAVDGSWADDRFVLAEISGGARTLLEAERTILNFMQRMSGVATYARKITEKAAGLTVLDTRKTMPGWRALDKYATRIGGARNHRMNLSDMILIKNNHIDADPKGIRGVLQQIEAHKPLAAAVEVEVRSIDELKVALEFRCNLVMLDNFSNAQIAEAMKLVRAAEQPPMIEVSGGITEARFKELAELKVDAVSMGSLTTRAPNVDISMRVTIKK